MKRNMYLGPRCKYGHEYNNTGMSLRYKKSKDCIECTKMRNEKYKYIEKQNNFTLKRNDERNARQNAALNCVHHGKCLDLAAKSKKRMKCHNCPDYKEENGVWQKEAGVDVLLAKKFDYTEYRVTEKY